MSGNVHTIEVNHHPIELCKLLKIANLVSGGGEAKVVISEGYVLVNDLVEYQKRKKIHLGDIVEFNGEKIQLALAPQQDNETPAKPAARPTDKSPHTQIKKVKEKPKQHKKASDSETANVNNGKRRRRPISF